MKSEELIEKLDQTTTDFLNALAAFSPEEVNVVPFEGSWTAGQVVEHVLKSETGLPNVLLGDTADTARPADAKVPDIDGVFLNFTTKLKSPDFIIPSNGPHDQTELIKAFDQERKAIRKIAGTEDLTRTCTSFPLPQMGELTRWEWINFIISHSIRHTRQLRNILQKVEG